MSVAGSSISNLICLKTCKLRWWFWLTIHHFHHCRYAEESVELLLNSGLQFDRHEREGIDVIHFAEMLIASGIVLLENVKWLSFHSGYDFG